MSRILVFGDSIAYGQWDVEGGWVQRLRRFIDEKYLEKYLPPFPDPNFSSYLVYNLGIEQEASEDLLKRVESEMKSRSAEKTLVIFSIGINDCRYYRSKKVFYTTLTKFEDNIQKLIEIGKKFSAKIAFLGLTPVDETKMDPSPWSNDESFRNENVKKYNDAIRKVCEKNNIHFIEIFDEWMKQDYKKFLFEGLHLNSKGHKKIFESVKDFSQK